MNPDYALRALVKASRSFNSISNAGQGDSGLLGTAIHYQPEVWLFAEITELPSRDDLDPDNDFPGYSGKQKIPRPDGTWADPDPDLEAGLTFDNGSTSGTPNSPLFEMNGDESVAVGTIVEVKRGYQRGGLEGQPFGQEWVFDAPGGHAACACPATPEGYTRTVHCQLDIPGSVCAADGLSMINTDNLVCVGPDGKFIVDTKTWTVPLPPCPTGPAGGALSVPYSADLGTTADTDPTAGKMRFDNVVQADATALRVSNASADGGGWANALESIANSTNPTKGQLRVFDTRDQTKFLTFDVTGDPVDNTTYKNIPVTNTGGSSANPFTDADDVTVAFTPAGNHGYAGGGISISYTFSTTTTDADPGSGHLRLSSATQNTSTVIRADLLDAAGADWTAALGAVYASTNAVKAHVRLFKTDDPAKFILWEITSGAAPSGYRNLTGAVLSSSAASPFADGDNVTLAATPVGNVGASGGPGTGTVTSVGLTMPGIFGVTNSPVTGADTLVVTLATESANTVFAGPTAGGAAGPTFRALVKADQVAATAYTDAANTFTVGGQVVAIATTTDVGLTVKGAAAQTGDLQRWTDNTPTTLAKVAADGAVTAPSFTGVGTALTALNASNLGSGTVPAVRMPAYTGDVTSPAGSTVNTLATVNSSVGGFGAANKTLTVTVNAKGLVTAVGDGLISIANTQVSGLGTMSTQNANSVTITGGSINGTTVGNTTPAPVTGTTGQFTGNLTVDGDLLVSGNTVTVNTATLSVEDPLIKLANGNAADAVDIGFYGLYSGGTYAGVFRDATDGKFRLFAGLTVEPTTTVNIAGAGYAAATLVLGALEVTTGTILHTNTAAPSTPASGKVDTWTDSTDKRFHDKDDAGTVGTTAVAKAAVSHQFFTAMNAAGVFTAAQPAFTDISGTAAVGQGGTGQTTAQAAINALLAASGALSQGDIFYYNGTNIVRLGTGTANQVLCSGGAGANPSWKTLSFTFSAGPPCTLTPVFT